MVIAGLLMMMYGRGVERMRRVMYRTVWGIMMVRRGIVNMSKIKVVVARSTRVHIRVMIGRVYIGEYRIVIVHMRIHRIIKVIGFVISRVISHCVTGRLDGKGRGRRRERKMIRTIRVIIRVIRLIRWIRRYMVTTKERMIIRIRGRRR